MSIEAGRETDARLSRSDWAVVLFVITPVAVGLFIVAICRAALAALEER